MDTTSDSDSIRSRSQQFCWTDFIETFQGTNIDPSIFSEQDFLNWTVLKATYLRDTDLRVLVKEDVVFKKYIVKDVVEDYDLLVSDGIDNDLRIKFAQIVKTKEGSLKCSNLFEDVVFMEELAKNPTKSVRTVIKKGQCFLYQPPGEKQSLALVIKNQNSVLECLLFSEEMDDKKGVSFKGSGEPIQRTLIMGSVGMRPLCAEFDICKHMKCMINSCKLNDLFGNSSRTKICKENLDNYLKRMPDCLFRGVPVHENFEICEGLVVELLNVRRDELLRDRYFPAESPHFLSATITNKDGDTLTLKVVSDGEETIYYVDMREGLIYPVGTAERLGVDIHGERSDDVEYYMQSVCGPLKYDGDEWRGYAELFMDDEDSPHIRPIVIRNIYDGMLTEFSYIDSLEEGSLLLPICSPRLLHSGFASQSQIPVKFNSGRVNGPLLNELFTGDRRDKVFQFMRHDDFHHLNELEMHEHNPVPLGAPYVYMNEEMLSAALEETFERGEDGNEEMMEEEEGESMEKSLDGGTDDGAAHLTIPPEENRDEEAAEVEEEERETGGRREVKTQEEGTHSHPATSLSTGGGVDSKVNKEENSIAPLSTPLVSSVSAGRRVRREERERYSPSDRVKHDHGAKKERVSTVLEELEPTTMRSRLIASVSTENTKRRTTSSILAASLVLPSERKRENGAATDMESVSTSAKKEGSSSVDEERKRAHSHTSNDGRCTPVENETGRESSLILRKRRKDGEVTLMEEGSEKREKRRRDCTLTTSIEEEDARDRGRVDDTPISIPLATHKKEDRKEDRGAKTDMKMSSDGIPSGSSNHSRPSVSKEVDESEKETKRMASESWNEEVAAKRMRMGSPTENGVELDDEKEKEKEKGREETIASKRGAPLDPSIVLYDLPPYQTRKVTERNSAVRGGSIGDSLVRRTRSTSVEEKLISGDEEMERIKMERVLKDLDMLRASEKNGLDKITPALMTRFRNPLEWNSLEVQLFLDQFDVEQALKEYVRDQDFDGMKFCSLKVDEILEEFPSLSDDFNEKVYFFGLVERIRKMANDDALVFAPPPFSIYDN